MSVFLNRVPMAAVVFMAGITQVHAGPIGGPGGEIAFDAVAALAVPVNGLAALAILAVGLGLLGVWAVRRHGAKGQIFSVTVLSAIAGAVLIAALAVPVYHAVARGLPAPLEVTGPETVSFTFPGAGQGDYFPVEFKNVSSQPLRIIRIETDCGDVLIDLPAQDDRVAATPECAVNAELAPEQICRIEPPADCGADRPT